MKSLLTALQEGRLIELPDNDKEKSLEYLATLIEAIPDIGGERGITETVLERERLHNTGIGKGWACPHARSDWDGELLCAVGWSPDGIAYGSPDNNPVHLVVMYFVPDGQKNSYLKEISSLAKSIQSMPSMQALASLTDLSEVRHRLLDAINAALESMAPDARARMIQLEVKHAAAEHAPAVVPIEIASQLVPMLIVVMPGQKPVVLGQDLDLVKMIDGEEHIPADLDLHGRSEHRGLQILLRSSAKYQADRTVHDCLVLRSSNGA
jgi:mannitol/fructose-specific phosphotransferase system IIA component (Ntr-type)